MADLKLSLDKAQVQAIHDVISRETAQFTTNVHQAPLRINELRLIQALMFAHLSNVWPIGA